MALDLLTLFDNFNPGIGGGGGKLDCFCTYLVGSPGGRPTGFVAPPPPFPSAKGLGMLL